VVTGRAGFGISTELDTANRIFMCQRQDEAQHLLPSYRDILHIVWLGKIVK
jgi:hypothetical protein